MTRQLAHLGHRVCQADGGHALLDLFRQAGGDLVISDVQMPCGGGLEAAEAIRRESAVPIILMAGRWEDDARAVAVGAVCLDKPFGMAGLAAALAAALAGADRVLAASPSP